MLDFSLSRLGGLLFVLAIEIVGPVEIHDGTAMRLNAFAFAIEPDLAGED
mgnify:CR=1 FL=1